MFDTFRSKIVDYVYVVSNQPVKLYQLLEANALYNEGMHLDGRKLGFRLKVGRAYLVFMILVNIIMIPLAVVTHSIFTKFDCHLSIFLAIIVTSVIMASFKLFKDWLDDCVAKKRIKKMWELHFPLFPYEEYNQKINIIYQQALKEGVLKNELERYIIEKISN
jgi:hypothetical protein